MYNNLLTEYERKTYFPSIYHIFKKSSKLSNINFNCVSYNSFHSIGAIFVTTSHICDNLKIIHGGYAPFCGRKLQVYIKQKHTFILMRCD